MKIGPLVQIQPTPPNKEINMTDDEIVKRANVHLALINEQAAEIERLHKQGVRLAETLIKYLPSNVRQSCDSAELWADIDGILYHRSIV